MDAQTYTALGISLGFASKVGHKSIQPMYVRHNVFLPEVPGATLGGDVGHFFWLPGRSLTLAAGDRLSIRHAAGPRQRGQTSTQDTCLFLNKALYLYLLNAAAVHSVGPVGICEEGAELQEHATVL